MNNLTSIKTVDLFALKLRDIPGYLFMTLLGLWCTYGAVYMNNGRVGWLVFTALILIIAIYDKKIPLFILFHVFLLKGLIYNSSIRNADIGLIKILQINESWVLESYSNLSYTFIIFVFFIIFETIFVRKNIIEPIFRKLLAIIIVMSVVTVIHIVFRDDGLKNTLTIFGFLIFPILLIIAIGQIYTRKQLTSIFPYFLFSIGMYQAILVGAFWIPEIISNISRFSGDFITGTGSSVTDFTHITGTALIIYALGVNNSKSGKSIILILTLIIFLGQSSTQIIVLICSIFAAIIFYRNIKIKVIINTLSLVAFAWLLTNVVVVIMPYLQRHIDYLFRILNLYYSLGILDNPKITGIMKIFSDFSNSDISTLLFGFGSGEFLNKYSLDIEYYAKIHQSMATTFHTSLNILAYDHGILLVGLFILSYFQLGRSILLKAKKNNGSLLHAGVGLVIFYCLTYLLFPTGTSILTGMIFGAFVGMILLICNEEEELTAH
jgi:hypothetical protein